MGMIIVLFYLAHAGAWVLVDVLQIAYRFPRLHRKPFTCRQCLTGWLAAILFLKMRLQIPDALEVAVDLPFYMAGAMFAGNFLNAAFRWAVNKSL